MMRYLLTITLCFSSLLAHSAQWIKLNESNGSKLMLDKQSVITQDQLKKAWVKMDYKHLQKNVESVEKEYNSAKALWFFDCAKQKTATTQVFQYLDQELVYSAGVEVKSAEFIEPLPDSDVEIAMRYVCKPERVTAVAKTNDNSKKATALNSSPSKQDSTNPEAAKPSATSANTAPQTKPTEAPVQKNPSAEEKPAPAKAKDPILNDKKGVKKSSAAKTAWSYDGKTGPEQWSKISPEYSTCESGRSQSPIDINSTIHAALKPIRAIQKFAAKESAIVDQALQVDFKKGNMMVIDSAPFQLKHLILRTPSEHTIEGKGFPLEAQWLHEDAKGEVVFVSVLFKEDKKSNAALDKLLAQLPNSAKPVALNTRILPSDIIPQDKRYFRYTGSMTTPPCTEGVRWVIMKTPQSISAEQLKRLSEAIPQQNARPIQASHGRTVLE
jgi:carbonic anhydrase